MKLIKNIFFIISLFTATNIIAQDYTIYPTFFDNRNFNTAYHSFDTGLYVSLTHMQNSNLNKGQRAFNVNVKYTTKNGLSVGARFIQKNLGIFKYTQIEGLMSKRMQISDNHYLFAGINLGASFNDFNTTNLNEFTDVDPDVLVQKKEVNYVAGFALAYNYNQRLNIGYSMPRLANSNQGMTTMFFFNASYLINKGKFEIIPLAMMYGLTYTFPKVEFGAKVRYNKMIWVKATGASNGMFNSGVGFNFKHFDLGYSYQYYTGQFQEISKGNHWITLAFKVPNGK
jgi:hypothetical protein